MAYSEEDDSIEIDISDEDTRREWDYDPRGERYFDVTDPYYDIDLSEEEEEEWDGGVHDDLGLGFLPEKKYIDFQFGYINGANPIEWLTDPSNNRLVFRREYDLCYLPQGIDNNRRIGLRVQAKRVSVRLITYLDPARSNTKLAWDNGLERQSGVMLFRFFIFIDKSHQWSDLYPKYGWSLNSGATAFNFEADRGFLQNASINSFYHPINIKQYRILMDSGVITVEPKYRNKQTLISAYNAAVPRDITNVVQPVLWQFLQPHGTLKMVTDHGTAIAEDTITDEISQRVTLSMATFSAYETPGGIGTTEGTIDTIPLLNNITTTDARSVTTINWEANPAGALQQYVVPRNAGYCEFSKASGATRTYEWNYDLDLTLQYADTGNPAGIDTVPIHNAIRFGVLYYSGAHNCCAELVSRVEYEDC